MTENAEHIPARSPGDDRDFWLSAARLRDARPARPWTDAELQPLLEFNRDVGAPDRVLDNAARLSDAGTLVVIAGQQAGLFLQPLYVIYKAVAAVKWAARLSTLLGRPVVPCFWIASEDHDFEEVRHVRYLDSGGRLREWGYGVSDPEIEPLTGRPVYDIPLRDGLIESFLAELERETRETEFRGPALEKWRRLARDSRNLEDFFARGMTDLLGHTGLVLVPSRLETLRRRAAPLIEREIREAGRTTELVQERIERVRAAGGQPVLHRRDSDVNFFVLSNGARCKVLRAHGGFELHHPVSGETVARPSLEELLARLGESPKDFSPNVITRPVVQDSVLPVIAMIGGGGERAYVGLLPEVYEFFGVYASRVLARPRALLLEPRVERYLEKSGVASSLLQREDWPALEDAFLRTGDFANAGEALERARSEIEAVLERFRGGLGRLEKIPAISNTLQKTLQHTETGLDRLEQRLHDEARREEKTATGQLDRLRDALLPDGTPQERVLGPLAPFLINYGPELIPWLVEGFDIDAESLQVLPISDLVKD